MEQKGNNRSHTDAKFNLNYEASSSDDEERAEENNCLIKTLARSTSDEVSLLSEDIESNNTAGASNR